MRGLRGEDAREQFEADFDALGGGFVTSALGEQFSSSQHRASESIGFCHRALGTLLDPSKLTT